MNSSPDQSVPPRTLRLNEINYYYYGTTTSSRAEKEKEAQRERESSVAEGVAHLEPGGSPAAGVVLHGAHHRRRRRGGSGHGGESREEGKRRDETRSGEERGERRKSRRKRARESRLVFLQVGGFAAVEASGTRVLLVTTPSCGTRVYIRVMNNFLVCVTRITNVDGLVSRFVGIYEGPAYVRVEGSPGFRGRDASCGVGPRCRRGWVGCFCLCCAACVG